MQISFEKHYNTNLKEKLEGGTGTTDFSVGDGGGGGC